jgi:hypothetical protein
MQTSCTDITLVGLLHQMDCAVPVRTEQNANFVHRYHTPPAKQLSRKHSKYCNGLAMIGRNMRKVYEIYVIRTNKMHTFYMNVLIPNTAVLRILQEDFCCRDLFLLHDNAPAHEAASVCQFFTPKMLQPFINSILSRFMYYFLFPKLKMKLKGLHFADVAVTQEAVTD